MPVCKDKSDFKFKNIGEELTYNVLSKFSKVEYESIKFCISKGRNGYLPDFTTPIFINEKWVFFEPHYMFSDEYVDKIRRLEKENEHMMIVFITGTSNNTLNKEKIRDIEKLGNKVWQIEGFNINSRDERVEFSNKLERRVKKLIKKARKEDVLYYLRDDEFKGTIKFKKEEEDGKFEEARRNEKEKNKNNKNKLYNKVELASFKRG